MNRNKRIITGITAGILLIAFFLPWWKLLTSVSGWEIVFGNDGRGIGGASRLILLILPLTGCVVLYSVLTKKPYVLPKAFLFILPLLAFGALFLFSLIGSNLSTVWGVFKSVVEFSSIGIWLTWIAALVLPFCSYTPERSSPPPSTAI